MSLFMMLVVLSVGGDDDTDFVFGADVGFVFVGKDVKTSSELYPWLGKCSDGGEHNWSESFCVKCGRGWTPKVAEVPAPMPATESPGPDYSWKFHPDVGWGWVHKDVTIPVRATPRPVVQSIVQPVTKVGRFVTQCFGGVCRQVWVDE